MARIDRILFFIPLFFTLIACNLSAGAIQEPTVAVVLTATPQPTETTEALADIDSDDDDTDDSDSSTITTTNTTSQQTANNVGVVSQSQASDLYYVYGDRLSGQCTIQAQVNTNIRTGSNTTANVVGQLVGGEWIPVVRIIDGWYQVDLAGAPVHRMWISSNPTQLDSNCRCEANGCYFQQGNIPPTPNVNTDTNLYYAGNPQPYPSAPSRGCYVYTAGDFPVNIRVAQSETASRIGQLRANQWIMVKNFINGWFGVDLPGTPIDGAYIANGPVRLTSYCTCNEVGCSTHSDPVPICTFTTHSGETTYIYSEPANWTRIRGSLVTGENYQAIAQSSSGWYQLEVGGWVPANYLQMRDGNACRLLPTIPYDPPIFDCELVNTTGEIQTIYTGLNGDYYGRFGSGLRLGIIQNDGNWYQVYVPAFSSAGWVDGTNMGLSGDCSEFE